MPTLVERIKGMLFPFRSDPIHCLVHLEEGSFATSDPAEEEGTIIFLGSNPLFLTKFARVNQRPEAGPSEAMVVKEALDMARYLRREGVVTHIGWVESEEVLQVPLDTFEAGLQEMVAQGAR